MSLPHIADLANEQGELDPYASCDPTPFICCDNKMALIYNAQQQKTKGWWCSTCNNFESAIGREGKLKPYAEGKA